MNCVERTVSRQVDMFLRNDTCPCTVALELESPIEAQHTVFNDQ